MDQPGRRNDVGAPLTTGMPWLGGRRGLKPKQPGEGVRT